MFCILLQFQIVCFCNALNGCFIRNVVVQRQEYIAVYKVAALNHLLTGGRNAPAQTLRVCFPLTEVYECICCFVQLISILQQCQCRSTYAVGLECNSDTFRIRYIVQVQRNFCIFLTRCCEDLLTVVNCHCRFITNNQSIGCSGRRCFARGCRSCCSSCCSSCCYWYSCFRNSCCCFCCRSSCCSGCSCSCFLCIANLNGQEVGLVFQASRINGFYQRLAIFLVSTNHTVHLQDDRLIVFDVRRTRFCIKVYIVIAIRCILRHRNIKCHNRIRIRLAIQPLCSIIFTVLHSDHIVVAIDNLSFWSGRVIVMDDTVICKHRICTRLCALLRYLEVISRCVGFFIHSQIQSKFLCSLGAFYRNDYLAVRRLVLTFCIVCAGELDLVRTSGINWCTSARFYCCFIGYNSPQRCEITITLLRAVGDFCQ